VNTAPERPVCTQVAPKLLRTLRCAAAIALAGRLIRVHGPAHARGRDQQEHAIPTAVSGPQAGGRPAGRRPADGCRAWPAGGPQTGAGLGRPAVAPDPHDPAATPHPSGPTPPLARPSLTVRACAQDTWPGGGPENQYDKVLLYIRIAPVDRIK
jgi:hypothetical protein